MTNKNNNGYHIERVAEIKDTQPKSLDVSQIYTLLDARARDYRAILLGIMAGCIGVFVAMVNSASVCLDGSKYEKFTGCFTVGIPLIYLCISIILFLIAAFLIGPEVRRVRLRSEYIRLKYIENAKDVPIVDGLLPNKTRVDNDEEKKPDK